MKIACLSMAVALCAAVVPVSAQAVAQHYDLNIPRQPLDAALKDFAHQTGLQIAHFSDTIDGSAMVGPIHGKLSVAQVLQSLLAPNGLTYKIANDSTIAIMSAQDAAAPPNNDDASDAPRTTGMDSSKAAAPEKIGETSRISRRFRLAQADTTASGARATEGAAERASARELIETIIVTANRREQRLMDVPMSIAALSHDDIAQQGVQSLLDLSRIVPGMVVSEFGPGQSRIFLRGVANGNGLTSLVGVYYDEIPVTGVSLGQRDIQLVDLERVEVLRGPQGTLYGQGSAGGTVRYISRKPDLDRSSAEFDLTGYATEGGDFTEKLTGVVNLPVVADKFGLRVSGTVAEIGGWNDQPAAGRENINNQSLRDGRIRALWQASDALAVDVTAIIHRNEGDGISVMVDKNYDVSYANSDPQLKQFLNDDFDIYNLTVTYDFGAARLVSSSSYIESSSAWRGVAFKLPGFENLISDAFDIESFAQEVRLSSAGEGKLNWVLGAFYTDDTADRNLSLDVYADGAFAGTVPLPGTTKSETYSIFGDVSYAVTDRLDLGVGLRYFNDDRTETSPGLSLGGSFHSVDPRFYATYALSDTVNLYANVAKGFRSGGFLGDAEASTFDPEKVWSYEIGTKGSAGRFGWDLSAYFSDYQDYQAFILVSNVFGGVENAGDAEIKGLDWLFTFAPTEHLTLQLNGNVVDTELVKVDPGATSNVQGDRLDLIYDYSVGASADYRFEWGVAMPGFVRLDFNQIGPATVTDRSLGIVEAPSDTIRLLSVRLGLERGKWAAELFGQNLLGADGLQDPFGAFGWESRPRPRTYGVTVRARF